MTLDDYKAELSESLYFGPWCDGFNPGKAQTLVRIADILSTLAGGGFVRWGEETKEYYETATAMFNSRA